MKFFTAIILTALLSFISGLYFPWWIIAVIAFLVAILVHQKAWKAFWSGFFGLFILWGILAFWIDIQNDHLLSKKIAGILPFGGNSYLLILATGVIGGLVAGFGALSGHYLRTSHK
ncbi:MAG: hypothetical protein JST23_06125 [Bacteroidetes bacterium]|nr:hypothetical protein [Bacteroidota bacterium]